MAGSEFVIVTLTTGISCLVSFLFRVPKAAGLSKIKMNKRDEEKSKKQIQLMQYRFKDLFFIPF